MNIKNIEVELRKIESLVARWADQGYVPQIEKSIALQRVQKFYELFLELDTQPQLQSSSEPIITPDPRSVPSESYTEPMATKHIDVVEYVEVERKVARAEPEQTFTVFGRRITQEQKTRFTHDLFCNDPLVFHNEIQKLERLTSLDEVLIYISERYAWVQGNASADELVEIIMEKF